MNGCTILGILLIMLIGYIVYKNDPNSNIIRKESREKLEDVKLDSHSPKYDDLYYSGLDYDKTKRTNFENGFKLEDDKTQCLCECKTKKTCDSSPTSIPTPNSSSESEMGYRINYYPWFIPYERKETSIQTPTST
jgi:hypothetical protein